MMIDPIKKHAHQYQLDAIEFGLKVKTPYFALGLGMGKTLISLAIVKHLKMPAIVFAPLKPVYNTWPEEMGKWAPELTYDIIHGINKYTTLNSSTADILLINYDSIKWFFENVRHIKRWKKRILILDESSMIKNPSTKRFKILKKLDPLWLPYKMCLSATPAPNGYHELWSQYFILDRGKRLTTAFGHFRNKYFHYTGPPVYKTTIRDGAQKEIIKLIKPITYRLDPNDYLKMPKIINNTISIQMPNSLTKLYKKLEDQFYLEFDKDISTAFNAAALGMKLRQFVQGALYLDDTKGAHKEIHKLKVETLKELIETAAGNPILCPIQFKFDLKMIHKYISNDIPCIAGGVSNKRANILIAEWNRGNLPLLLCHPASIGHGMNLQAGGHNLLWYAQTWSLEQYQQLNGRLIRQGQQNASVVINHLVTKNTVDEKVVKVLTRKDATQTMLLNALKR